MELLEKLRGAKAATLGRLPLKERHVVVGAIAAFTVVSIVVLLPSFPTRERREAALTGRLANADFLIRNGSLDRAETLLNDVIRNSQDSPQFGRAQFLQGSLLLRRFEIAGTIDLPKIEAVNEAIVKSRRFGVPEKDLDHLSMRLADLLLDSGFYREALNLYRPLSEKDGGAPILLKMATAFAFLSAPPDDGSFAPRPSREKEAEFYCAEALGAVDRYIATAEKSEKIDALLVKASVFRICGKSDRAFAVLDEVVELAAGDPRDVVALLVRARLRLDRKEFPEAVIDLRKIKEMKEDLSSASIRNDADYHLADISRSANDRKLVETCNRLIMLNAASAPLAMVTLGRFHAVTKEGDYVKYIAAGLSKVPHIRYLREYGFDMEAFCAELDRLWSAEKGEIPLRYLAVLDELVRLHPGSLRYLRMRASLSRQVAEAFRSEANALRRDNPAEAEKLDKSADSRFLGAALQHMKIGLDKRRSEDDILAAHQDAADLFRAGKFYAKAAEQYGMIALLSPREKRPALFKQATALREGGILTTDDADRPGALEVFERCIDRDTPANDISRRALIEKGKILAALGRHEQAADLYGQIVGDKDGLYGLTPDAEEWKQALYARGEALYRASSRRKREKVEDYPQYLGEAKRSLLEFIERYAQPRPHRLCMMSSQMLALCFAEEGDLTRAAEYFRKAVAFGTGREEELEHDELEALKRAHFTLGDTLYALDRCAEAAQSYEVATRRYSASRDRIWGLVGLARCHARMGKRDEALGSLESARTLLKDFADAFKESTPGFGVEFWTRMIDEIAGNL